MKRIRDAMIVGYLFVTKRSARVHVGVRTASLPRFARHSVRAGCSWSALRVATTLTSVIAIVRLDWSEGAGCGLPPATASAATIGNRKYRCTGQKSLINATLTVTYD
jgi:hypothetical protein